MSAPLTTATSRSPLVRTTLVRAGVAATVAVLALALLAPLRGTGDARPAPPAPLELQSAAAAPNPVTPGDFRGYGFDQCLTPTQAKMDAWRWGSPYLAVGVYISGNSRFCRSQPNLTPTWVATQLARGWKILPITLGPQASCLDRFPRYGPTIDPTINPDPTNTYAKARAQAVAEANKAVTEAMRLGIVRGSTLWYDLEGWSLATGGVHCRESAMRFLSSWTARLRALGYVSGVYSSAGSGIRMLEEARVNTPGRYVLPHMIWIARWDGKANTSTTYISEAGWRPGRRVKQYRGGHNETWGGVTINIDSNYMDLGRGAYAKPESHCGGTVIDWLVYPTLRPGTAVHPAKIKSLQCLLREYGHYKGALHGRYDAATIAAAKAWMKRAGNAPRDVWGPRDWITLLSGGSRVALKLGSAGPDVRRVQRALRAANPRAGTIDGTYQGTTYAAVRRYQSLNRLRVTGIVDPATWNAFAAGRYRR